MKICLDTDMAVDYLRDNHPVSDVVQHWFDAASVYLTSISSFELYHGAFYSRCVEDSVNEVEIFINNLEGILPFTENASEIAGKIMSKLRREQKSLEIRDLFIGAICIENNVPLITRNISHFERLKNLKIVEGTNL